MTAKNLVLIVLSSLVMTACGKRAMFAEYRSISMDGWHMDSTVLFRVPVSDTIQPCNVILHVRHTDAYPYQNMWLFVQDGPKTDTIEFYLFNDRGQWLGNGSSIHDMPVLYRENVVMKDSVYTIAIQQGMRDVVLRGVSEIGVEVVR